MTQISFPKLCIAVVTTFAAAAIGSSATYPAIQAWYVYLQKPLFSPPNWLFGPVWTVLYLLMAIALYLYWTSKQPVRQLQKGIFIFGVQLSLNAVWSLLFFGARSPLMALIEIIFLWSAILWTILEFRKVNTKAAILLIPYLAWVSFATILNLAIVLLN